MAVNAADSVPAGGTVVQPGRGVKAGVTMRVGVPTTHVAVAVFCGVGVTVFVGVSVAVSVGVLVGVSVGVFVLVLVGVAVEVGVEVIEGAITIMVTDVNACAV